MLPRPGEEPHRRAPVCAPDDRRRGRRQVAYPAPGARFVPEPALERLGQPVRRPRPAAEVLRNPPPSPAGEGLHAPIGCQADHPPIERLQCTQRGRRLLLQPGGRLGVAAGLDQVGAEEVEDEPVALGEVGPAPVERDPDDQRPRAGTVTAIQCSTRTCRQNSLYSPRRSNRRWLRTSEIFRARPSPVRRWWTTSGCSVTCCSRILTETMMASRAGASRRSCDTVAGSPGVGHPAGTPRRGRPARGVEGSRR